LIALQKELADAGIQETTEYSRAIHRVAADAEYDFSALAEVAWTSHTKAIEAWLNAPARSDIAMRTQVV